MSKPSKSWRGVQEDSEGLGFTLVGGGGGGRLLYLEKAEEKPKKSGNEV